MKDKLASLHQKTGGFLKGVCHPSDDCALLARAGIAWVRRDVPFPLDKSGRKSESYLAYLARSRMFLKNGIRSVSVTPYPQAFLSHAIDVTTREGLARAGEVCAEIARDFRGTGACWQATNEMHIQHFRAPLSETQAKDFLVACIRGLKRGDPQAAVGHNSADETWLDLCAQIEQETGGCDYTGLDLYDGTWSDGGPDTYGPKIDKVAEKTGKPVILMEFGFASKGGVMRDPYAEAAAYLRARGISSIEEARSNATRLISILPEPIAGRVRACAPEDRIPCAAAGIPHILKKWPGKSDIPHTEEGQAQFYARLLPKLLSHPRLGGFVMYCLADSARCFYCGQADCPCETAWGLVRADGTPKPAYEAVRQCLRA